MAKIFGGSASRLEVYALFAAAVVLIGGSVAGAVVVTSGGETSAPVTVVETSSTTTTAVPVEVTVPSTTAAPINQPPPPTSRYVDPPPVTVTPEQPIQDFSAYCTMPNMIGTFTGQDPIDSLGGFSAARSKLEEANCITAAVQKMGGGLCFTDSLPFGALRIMTQDPSPGTLVHRSLGNILLGGQQSSVGWPSIPGDRC
jgi:hypothetical protein